MRPFRSCLRGLWQLLRSLRGRVAVSIFIGLLAVSASLAFVWISKRIVDIATGTRADAALAPHVWGMVGIMAVQVLCAVAARYWNGLLSVYARNRTRAAVFGKVMRSVWSGRERFHSGDVVNRLEGDIDLVVDFLCTTLPEGIVTFVQLLAASVYLIVLAPDMAWILLLIMPTAVLCSRLFFRKLRALTNEIRADDSAVQGLMQENLQHRVLVKTTGSLLRMLGRLDRLQAHLQGKTVERLNYGAVSRGFMQLGFAAGYALVFFWGVFGLRDGTVTYGTMVAFLQLVSQVQRPVANLASQIPAFIRALSSQDRLQDLADLPLEEDGADIRLPGTPGVRVEGLSFSYDGNDTTVLRDLDFDFKPGTMTVVLGTTGSGKSTLARLIMALLAPDAGRVLLYGEGGAEVLSSARTRCNFRYVPQGNSLMSGTIRENLTLACPDAREEDVRDALHVAAADFVYDFANGLDTACAEVGAGLSEGQAQRIAIARALLSPGGILVLDEATSALDGETETQLLRRLSGRYHGNVTIICITHRPAATDYADAVLKIG
ncbi:MAG: ABC transporter ATP-binding protein [Bacteroidales bacterium]|nr:ABC transporter ATP-binding protein [Bacteroidales bacterium]